MFIDGRPDGDAESDGAADAPCLSDDVWEGAMVVVGVSDGFSVGVPDVVPDGEREMDGIPDGVSDGEIDLDGVSDGILDGYELGSILGTVEGISEGYADGVALGKALGILVGPAILTDATLLHETEMPVSTPVASTVAAYPASLSPGVLATEFPICVAPGTKILSPWHS